MALGQVCKKLLQQKAFCIEEFQLDIGWDDVICPICLDYPHNGVLLQCSSYDKGCRPFVCDTDHLHSNCLDRFINANGMASPSNPAETQSKVLEDNSKPACPLCRGEVTGWVIIDEARNHLDCKKRCCEEEQCKFIGTYMELHKHAELEHPDSCPSQIDPARKLDWENFQQSSEIIDVLTTIHSEVPRGVVLGDYVIEYGDDDDDDDDGDTGDEFEGVRSGERNWWTSCIIYKVFNNIRNSRNRRRSRMNNGQRGSRRSSSDDSSISSLEFPQFGVDETDGDFINMSGGNSHSPSSVSNSSGRRRTRFHEY